MDLATKTRLAVAISQAQSQGIVTTQADHDAILGALDTQVQVADLQSKVKAFDWQSLLTFLTPILAIIPGMAGLPTIIAAVLALLGVKVAVTPAPSGIIPTPT